MVESPISRLQELIDQSERIVFFGGAGVSTESGIPDFRSADGLYLMKYYWPPETIVSRSFFDAHPAEFFDFYRHHLVFPAAQPNPAHHKLAELEQTGRLTAIITQNIDGLHQAAGSRNVIELHGSVHRNTCLACGDAHPLSTILESVGLPHCPCGGLIKPDVVLYEEIVASIDLAAASTALADADLLIIGGTSLAVYPAAGLVDDFTGPNLVVINITPIPADATASLIIPAKIAQTLAQINLVP